jgi:hypothetical protein
MDSQETAIQAGRHKKTRVPRWLLVAMGIVLVLAVVAGILLKIYAEPILRQRAEDMLSSRFHSEVEIQEFHITLFPMLRLAGSGVSVRLHGRRDVPPLISVHDFSASTSFWSIFRKPWHINKIALKGLTIQIPPREKREGKLFPMSSSGRKPKDVQVHIDELISDQAELDILSGKPDKSPHQFLIHNLVMRDLGPGHGAPFEANLTNATPPGEIHVKGNFGPWQADDPRTTPLGASYTFKDADLSVFKGIAGILSSTGSFKGVLESMEVQGETTTPDFTVDTGGNPVMLKTEFSATVDGTNGDTMLHPVTAHIGNTTLVCTGGVVGPTDKNLHGKEVILDIVAKNGRIEDLLRLAVKGDKPPISGPMQLTTKFDLPPADPRTKEKVMDRLKLTGRFSIDQGRFSDPKVREKIEDLSRRGQGHPKDEDVGDSLTALRSNFSLNDALIGLSRLSFSVTGANVQLDGTYGIRSEELEFHGKLHLQAKPSQAVTGVKSWLLKPFDPFFRKNGVTEIPIKVTGKRSDPSFGLDFGHKSGEKSKDKKGGGANGKK